MEGEDSTPAAQQSVAEPDLRALLEAFYVKHNPEKIGTLDTILERYKGKEDQLVLQLKQKYGAAADPVLFATTITASPKQSHKVVDDSKGINKQISSPNLSNNSGAALGTNTISAGANLAATFLTGVAGVGWRTPNQTKKEETQSSSPSSTSSMPPLPAPAPAPSSTSSSSTLIFPTGNDEASLLTRISVLQMEIHSKEEEKIQLVTSLKQAHQQVTNLKKEKQKQSSDIQDLMQKSESLQKNLTAALDRETKCNKDIENLTEQLQMTEKSRQDQFHSYERGKSELTQSTDKVKQELIDQLTLITEQRDNKHEQLLAVIQINHRLSAQLRFLVSRFLASDKSISIDKKNSSILSISATNTSTNTSNVSSTSEGGERRLQPVMDSETSVETDSTSDISRTSQTNTLSQSISSENISLSISTPPPIPPSVSASAAAAVSVSQSSVLPSDSPSDASEEASTEIPSSLIDQSPTPALSSSELKCQLDTLISVNAELQAQLLVCETSLQASRVELQISMREKQQAESALQEQGLVMEELQKKLNGILNELETASGSADTMKQQMSNLTADLAACSAQVVELEKKLKARIIQCETHEAEMRAVRDSLQAADTIKKQLAQLCTEHSRAAEAHALRIVSELSERMVMEREEYLSKLAILRVYEMEARSTEENTVQSELMKLREELFKSRRAEAQKDRELVFMQRQLCDAAGTIARMMEDTSTAITEKSSSMLSRKR